MEVALWHLKLAKNIKRREKKELVEIAKKVFIKKGFVHTSMQDIMEKAGISRGALYSYFDNIEDVFLEVLKYDDQKDIQYFVSSDEGSIWLQLKNWVEEQRLYIERIDQTLLYARAEFFCHLITQMIKIIFLTFLNATIELLKL